MSSSAQPKDPAEEDQLENPQTQSAGGQPGEGSGDDVDASIPSPRGTPRAQPVQTIAPILPSEESEGAAYRRRNDAAAAVDAQAKTAFQKARPFAPSGEQPLVDESLREQARQQSDVSARQQAIVQRRQQMEQVKAQNAQREAAMQGSGQRFYTDPYGNKQPIIETSSGKALYHPGQWTETTHPDTGLPVMQRRDQYGEMATKHPRIVASPDLNDNQAYYTAADGTTKPYGKSTLDELKDHPDFGVQRMALAAITKRNAAIHKEALAGAYQDFQGAKYTFDQANDQIAGLADQATKISALSEQAAGNPTMQAGYQASLEQIQQQMAGLQAQTKRGGELELAHRQAALRYHMAQIQQKQQSFLDAKNEVQARAKAGQALPGDQQTMAAIDQQLHETGARLAQVTGIARQEMQAGTPSPTVGQPVSEGDALTQAEPGALAAKGVKFIGNIPIQRMAQLYGDGSKLDPGSVVKMIQRSQSLGDLLSDSGRKIDPKTAKSFTEEKQYLDQLTAQRMARLPEDQQKRVTDLTRNSTIGEKLMGAGKSMAESAAEGGGAVLKGLGMLAANSPLGDPRSGVMSPLDIQEAERRMKRTPSETMKEMQDSPASQLGSFIQDAAKEAYAKTPLEHKGAVSEALNAAAGAAGGFAPLVASGPLAPATIGLQTAGEDMGKFYDEAIAKGATPDRAADFAMKRAMVGGAVQAAIFELLPKPLQKTADKLIVDKITGGVLKRFLANRVAQAGEGAVLGGASQVASNVVGDRPIGEDVASSAAGMAGMQAIMPRGTRPGEKSAEPPPAGEKPLTAPIPGDMAAKLEAMKKKPVAAPAAPEEKSSILQEPQTPAQESALAIHQGLKAEEKLRQSPEGAIALKEDLSSQEKRVADFYKAKLEEDSKQKADELNAGIKGNQVSGPSVKTDISDAANAAFVKLDALDKKHGVGIGATKERARQIDIIERERSNKFPDEQPAQEVPPEHKETVDRLAAAAEKAANGTPEEQQAANHEVATIMAEHAEKQGAAEPAKEEPLKSAPPADQLSKLDALKTEPVNIGKRDETVSTGDGNPTEKEKAMLAEQKRLVDEYLAKSKQPENPSNAIPNEIQKTVPEVKAATGTGGESAPRGDGEPGNGDGGTQNASELRPKEGPKESARESSKAVRAEVKPKDLSAPDNRYELLKGASESKLASIAKELGIDTQKMSGERLRSRISTNATEEAIKAALDKPAERTSDKIISGLADMKRNKKAPGSASVVSSGEEGPKNNAIFDAAHDAAIDAAILAVRAGRAVADVIKIAIGRFKERFPGHTADHVATFEKALRDTLGVPTPEPPKKAAAKPVEAAPSAESTGIAHRVSEARGVDAERGEGISKEEAVAKGRELLANGFDVEKAIKDFHADPEKKVSAEAVMAARAKVEELAKATNAAEDKFGVDSPEYKAADKAERDLVAQIKPWSTEGHKFFMAHQGETDIDTGTVSGLRRAVRNATGKEMTPKQEADAKRIASEVSGATDAADKAKETLLKTADTGKEPTADSITKAETAIKGHKPGANWTPEEAKALWHAVKAKYLSRDVTNINDIRAGLATDYGLTKDDVYRGLASPKGVRALTDDMYRKMSEQRRVVNQAKQWVAESKYPGYEKFFRGIPNAFFNLSTFGHGTVWTVTHAGNQYFLPKATGQLFKDLGRSFKLMGVHEAKIFGGPGMGGYHERMMQDLVRDQNYIKAKRAGLANDPEKGMDDYQNPGVVKLFKDIGLMGNRGFDGMKLFRQFRFNQEWNTMPDSLKTPDGAKLLADNINKATGITKSSKLPNWMNTAFFAPKLEMSRWAFLYGDPVKDMQTIMHGLHDKTSVKPEELHNAYRDMRQKVTMAGTYLGALALNQAILSATGSDQKVNLTNPRSGDWMSFKGFGHQAGVIGPMISSVRFLQNIAHDFWGERTKLEQIQETRGAEAGTRAWEYARGKLAPFAGIALDVASQSNSIGRPLPFSNDPVSYRAKRMGYTTPYTYGEYTSTKMLPIPVEEAMQEIWKSQGHNEDDISKWMRAFAIGAASGGTGVRIAPEPPPYVPKKPAHAKAN